MKAINLFCFPYAGGDRFSYRQFEKIAPLFLNVVTLEYPGRGSRTNDPFVTDIKLLVTDLYNQISDRIHNGEYALYGHSLGGLLAYLLTKEILANYKTPPIHLFISGTIGPSALAANPKKRHLMNREEFISEVRKLNGSSDEILQNEDIVTYFEPILRADFKTSESYVYEESELIDIPLTIFYGTQDEMSVEEIQQWQKEVRSKVDFRRFPGNHFFIQKYPKQIMELISKRIIINDKNGNE